MQISPAERDAIKSELKMEILEEMTRIKKEKAIITKILDEFDEKYLENSCKRYVIRSAISALIKEKYKIRNVGLAEYNSVVNPDDIRNFIASILKLMYKDNTA